MRFERPKQFPSFSFFLHMLTMFFLAVFAPDQSLAGEGRAPASSSDTFSPGTLALSLGSNTGIYHMRLHYKTVEDDYYGYQLEDYSSTSGTLGFSLGYFVLPRTLAEMDISISRLKYDDDSYRKIYFGGGFSYWYPFYQRVFLDLGVEGGLENRSEKHPSDSYLESESDTNGIIGAHSALGFFLARNLALSLGLYYEHEFKEYSPDILGIRARFSFFFPLKRGGGVSGGNVDREMEG